MDILSILVVTNMVTVGVIGFLLAEIRTLWREIAMIPDPKTVLQELIASRLPIVMGPDGLPRVDVNNPLPKIRREEAPPGIG